MPYRKTWRMNHVDDLEGFEEMADVRAGILVRNRMITTVREF